MKRKILIGALTILFAAICFFSTQSLVQVSGRSMEPGFKDGEIRLVNKAIYWVGDPKRGDVVFYRLEAEGKNLSAMGRVVGLPNDRLEFKEKGVWINGEKIAEPYLSEQVDTYAVGGMPELILGEGEYAVLGDNRMRSRDSRQFGAVRRKDILGKFW